MQPPSSTFLPVLIQGVILGLGAAVPIGPVNVEIARRTIRHGFRAGFALGCGAVTVDVSYAVVASLGGTIALGHGVLYWPLLVAGTALLAYLGATCWVAAWRAWRSDPLAEPAEADAAATDAGPVRPHAHYVTGLLMTLLNPMTLAFWFVVVPAAIPAATGATGAGGGERGGRDLPIICVGVFIGTLAWVVTFAGLMSLAAIRGAGRGTGRDPARRAHRRRAWLAGADAVGGAVLLGFAAAALLRSLR